MNAGSSVSVLLMEARFGQCRAIVGYLGGCSTSAVVCGLPVVPSVVTERGVTIEYSWCPAHKAVYLRDPADAVHIPKYCR